MIDVLNDENEIFAYIIYSKIHVTLVKIFFLNLNSSLHDYHIFQVILR
jgi:hypothetical protein